MAHWFLVMRKLRPIVLTGLCLAWSATSLGDDSISEPKRQEMRLYKINKDGITQRLRFTTKKSRTAGCHNLMKRARLYRAMQFGFTQCRIYATKDCAQDSLMEFKREKEDEQVTDLTQGYSWYPIGAHERGELVRSWQCE